MLKQYFYKFLHKFVTNIKSSKNYFKKNQFKIFKIFDINFDISNTFSTISNVLYIFNTILKILHIFLKLLILLKILIQINHFNID